MTKKRKTMKRRKKLRQKMDFRTITVLLLLQVCLLAFFFFYDLDFVWVSVKCNNLYLQELHVIKSINAESWHNDVLILNTQLLHQKSITFWHWNY